MEGICGVFSSSVAASWTEAVLTGLAAVVAVVVYAKTRQDAQRDKESQRAVLEAMLRPNLEEALRKARASFHLLDLFGIDDSISKGGWNDISEHVGIKPTTRLNELQGRLIEIGQQQDADVAAFIEAARGAEELRARINASKGPDSGALGWIAAIGEFRTRVTEADKRGTIVAARLGINLPK